MCCAIRVMQHNSGRENKTGEKERIHFAMRNKYEKPRDDMFMIMQRMSAMS